MGIFLGLFEENENSDFSIYQMMIGIQPYSLQVEAGGELSREELEVERSEFVRKHLPNLK